LETYEPATVDLNLRNDGDSGAQLWPWLRFRRE